MIEWIMEILGLALIVGLIVWCIRGRYRREIVTQGYEMALLLKNGVLLGELAAGKKVVWGRGYEVARVDARWNEHIVQAQEFLTADRVAVKVSGLVRYRVADVKRYFTETQAAEKQLYSVVQLALRDVVGTVGIEAVLERQADLGSQLRSLVEPAAAQLGLELDAVVVRDLMLAGDLKRAYQATLTAKQEALARLEEARGEAAAMRVTANAARLYEKNPVLLKLRALDAVASLGMGANSHLVTGSLESLLRLAEID